MQQPEDKAFAEFRRTGDPVALAEVFDLCSTEVLQVAVRLCRDPAEAEDLLQQTFLTAIERAQTYDPERRLMPWLMGILTNLARRHRAQVGRDPEQDRLSQPFELGPLQQAEESELKGHLDEALAGLPVAWQPVAILRLRHGLTAPEIAHALRRPPGTVRSQLYRALETLRGALPAGIAGAIAVLITQAPGMAAVRAAVVDRAKELSLAKAGVGIFTAAALPRLIQIAAVLLLAVGLGVWISGWSPGTSVSDGISAVDREGPAEEVELADVDPDASTAATAVDPAADRSSVRIAGEDKQAAAGPRPATLGTLRVRVTYAEDGQRASGVSVTVQPMQVPRPDLDSRTLVTSGRGAANFAQIPLGLARVRVLRVGEQEIFVRPGRNPVLHFRVRRGMTLAGRVIDESGAPVPRAMVWLSQRGSQDDGEDVALSDEGGRFYLRAVATGQCVGARKDGHAPSALQYIEGRPGEVLKVSLVLGSGGAALRGKVLGPGGEPLDGAQVSIQPLAAVDDVESFATVRLPATGADGSFETMDLPVGSARIEVRAAGCAVWYGKQVLSEFDTPSLTIRLERGGSLGGVITGVDGKPAAGATVDVRAVNTGVVARTWCDPAGGYSLQDLPTGEVIARASLPLGGIIVHETGIESGGTTNWSARLEPRQDFHGRLVSESGEALVGWGVRALRDDGATTLRSEPTNESGEFTLPGFGDRVWTLRIYDPEDSAVPRLMLREVTFADDHRDHVVPGGAGALGSFRGTVVDTGGTPPPSAKVHVWHEESKVARVFAVDPGTGEFDAGPLPPGPCRLEVQSDHHPTLELPPATIVAGETVEIDAATLGEPGWIEARLESVDGDALPGLQALILDGEEKYIGAMERVYGSDWLSTPLPSGRFTLLLWGEGIESRKEAIEVVTGERRRHTFLLHAVGLRNVVFKEPEGAEPARWLSVSLEDGKGKSVWSWYVSRRVDGFHTVRVSSPPGDYTLIARSDNGYIARAPLHIGNPGELLEPAEFQLAPNPSAR